MQLHPGQLLDQCIEHRPAGQLEGGGVVDDGVATVNHQHLGAYHFNFFQLYGSAVQEDVAGVLPLFTFFEGQILISRFIAGALCLQDVSAAGRHPADELIGFQKVQIFNLRHQQNGAVSVHHRQL